MRILLSSLLLSVVFSSGLVASAQTRSTPNRQVAAMVEALRKAAPRTNNPNDGLYSDWQVKPETARGWSKQCLGRDVTPTQFANSPAIARQVITCVVQDEFSKRLRATANNEMKTVQSVACWWMTGQYQGCDRGATATYVQQVTRFYQQSRP
ncbi:MAG: hypothetical protein NW220_19670 [Leptolyngbyaceae cyanobacterium bins.349]|nr:hypothetical protein [Leptolyngbyaceae cyanobacterium bins.349]